MAVNWATLAKDFNIFEGTISKHLDAAERKTAKKQQTIGSLRSELKSQEFDTLLKKARSTFHTQSQERTTQLAETLSSALRATQKISDCTSVAELQKTIDSVSVTSSQLLAMRPAAFDESVKSEVSKVIEARSQEIAQILQIQVSKLKAKDEKVASSSKWSEFLHKSEKLAMFKVLGLFAICQCLQWVADHLNENEQQRDQTVLQRFCEVSSKATFVHILLATAEYYILRDKEFSGVDNLDFAFQYFQGEYQKLSMILDLDEHHNSDKLLKSWLFSSFVTLLKKKFQSIIDTQDASLRVKGNMLFIFCKELKSFTDSLFENTQEASWAANLVLTSQGKQILVDFSKEVFQDMDIKNVELSNQGIEHKLSQLRCQVSARDVRSNH